jgi:hypothetical protein
MSDSISISSLLRKYQVELFGVAAAFLVILIVRLLFKRPEPKRRNDSPSTQSTESSPSTTNSGKMETVNVSMSELKDGQMKEIPIGESSAIVVVKDKNEVFAFSSKCSHSAAPLKV